jgi:hypothetical protein
MPETIDRLTDIRETLPVNIRTEQLLSLPQAARRFPPYRQERPVSPSTIWRWISAGVRLPDGRRVKLAAIRLSGRWLTSLEAIERFVAAQTPTLTDAGSLPRTQAKGRHAAEKAGKELEKLGI